jgi:chromosomal replication initiation ATPase DnaA
MGGDFLQVIALVANRKRIPLRLLVNHARCRAATARARQLAMYLSHVVYGHTMVEVGEAFGRDRTTVSHACALIEDMRDDDGFDAEVSALEEELLGSARNAH